MENNSGLVILATGEMTFDASGDPDAVVIPVRCKRFILRQTTSEAQVGYSVYAPTIADDPWVYYPAETHIFSAIERGIRFFKVGDIPGYIASSSGSMTMVWKAEG